jgi:hypothetical protein
MRTIGMQQALEWSCELLRPMRAMNEDLRVLVEARNGLVHLGGERGTTVSVRVIDSYLRAMGELLAGLAIPGDQFWGEVNETVESRLMQEAQRIRRGAEERILEAKIRYEEGRPASYRLAQGRDAAEVLPQYRDWDWYDIAEDCLDYPCPACGRNARLFGDFVMDSEPYPGPVEDRDLDRPVSDTEFFPIRLTCYVCGLHLEGNDELRVAGVKGSWLTPSRSKEWDLGARYDFDREWEAPPEGAEALDWGDWTYGREVAETGGGFEDGPEVRPQDPSRPQADP